MSSTTPVLVTNPKTVQEFMQEQAGLRSVGTKDLTNYLLWFLIAGVIGFIVLYLLKPTLIQKTDATGKPTGEVDWVKALIGAIIAGLIVALLVWAFKSCA